MLSTRKTNRSIGSVSARSSIGCSVLFTQETYAMSGTTSAAGTDGPQNPTTTANNTVHERKTLRAERSFKSEFIGGWSACEPSQLWRGFDHLQSRSEVTHHTLLLCRGEIGAARHPGNGFVPAAE